MNETSSYQIVDTDGKVLVSGEYPSMYEGTETVTVPKNANEHLLKYIESLIVPNESASLREQIDAQMELHSLCDSHIRNMVEREKSEITITDLDVNPVDLS